MKQSNDEEYPINWQCITDSTQELREFNLPNIPISLYHDISQDTICPFQKHFVDIFDTWISLQWQSHQTINLATIYLAKFKQRHRILGMYLSTREDTQARLKLTWQNTRPACPASAFEHNRSIVRGKRIQIPSNNNNSFFQRVRSRSNYEYHSQYYRWKVPQ